MNTLHVVKGLAALVLVTTSVMAVGCVGQTDSDEAVAEVEQAINPTAACPQGPDPVLVVTGAAEDIFPDNYDGPCAGGPLLRLAQYTVEVTAPTDLATQCRNWCTDFGRFPSCGVGWRLDSAANDPLVLQHFTPLDTANLGILAERPLQGQSLAGNQEVTCINRPGPIANATFDDEHQWAAICSCSNL